MTYQDRLNNLNLPTEVKETMQNLIYTARGDGLEPIQARNKLKALFDLTEAQIIEIYNKTFKK